MTRPTWYVATNGNDAWSGRLPAPNAARTDGPFATLTRSRDAIRAHRQHATNTTATGGRTVLVREGVYRLTNPLTLLPQDSGTEAMRITYAAYPGEKVELKGSRLVTGWKPFRDSIYRTDLSAMSFGTNRFRQLFYKGRRQILARRPNFDPHHPRSGGFLYLTATLDAATGAAFTNPPARVLETVSRTWLPYNPQRLDPARWSKPTGVRVHIWPWLNWNRDCIGVKSFDRDRHALSLQRPASYPLIEGNRFFVENAMEELDSPGEWYYDEAARQLYFWPPDGANPEGVASIPVLPVLVELQRDKENERFVEHVRLRGFAMTESQDALVTFRMAAHCELATCTLENCGGIAVEMADRSHHNRVAGCDIAHTGGSGIVLNEVRDWTHTLTNRISYNVICNNHLHDVGELGNAVGAIVINPGCGGNVSHDNVICHNLIHDTPHQGINFNGFRNIVEYNHVHHVNQEYSDSGGIGMHSRDIYERGSIIRYNSVHDTGGYSMLAPGHWRHPYFTWGIYLDGFTSGVRVYGNIIARAPRGGVKIHGGQDNVISNNVVLGCRYWQIEYDPIDSVRMGTSGRNPAHPDKTLWLMTGNRLVGNVFSFADGDAVWVAARVPKWKQMIAESDRNVVWHHGKPVAAGWWLGAVATNCGWTAWQRMGFDANSVIANPLFADPSRGDYRLRSDSPALKLGFRPIPAGRIGLFPSPDRASWPVRDDCPREKHLFRPEAGVLPEFRSRISDTPLYRRLRRLAGRE